MAHIHSHHKPNLNLSPLIPQPNHTNNILQHTPKVYPRIRYPQQLLPLRNSIHTISDRHPHPLHLLTRTSNNMIATTAAAAATITSTKCPFPNPHRQPSPTPRSCPQPLQLRTAISHSSPTKPPTLSGNSLSPTQVKQQPSTPHKHHPRYPCTHNNQRYPIQQQQTPTSSPPTTCIPSHLACGHSISCNTSTAASER